MTFLAMYVLGIDLQRISLGALIIALGLLVDDAIIAVEMMALKLEQGWDRFRAATFAYTATAFPMLTGTLITAAGFLPVGFAKSGTGEYVVLAVPGGRHLAGPVVDRRGAVHPVPRLQAAEGAPARRPRRGRGLPARLLRTLPPLRGCVPGPPRAGDRHHAGALRRFARAVQAGAAAVLSGVRPPRADGRPVAARGVHLRGDRARGARRWRPSCERIPTSSPSPATSATAARASTCRSTSRRPT